MCAARWRALQPFAFAATSICAPLSSVLGGMGRRGSRGRERECAGGSRCQEGTGRVSGGSSRRAVRNLSMSYSAALLTASINSLFLFCWSPSSNLCARSSEDLAMCVTVWGSTKSTNRQEVRTQRYYGVTLTKDPGRLRLSQGASLKPDESEGCSVSGGRTIRLCSSWPSHDSLWAAQLVRTPC